MSRYHKSSTGEVNHMIQDATQLSHHELMRIYNIEIWANDTVEEDADDFDYDDEEEFYQ